MQWQHDLTAFAELNQAGWYLGLPAVRAVVELQRRISNDINDAAFLH